MDTSADNPFPGLRPFEYAENYLFFGRDEQNRELLSKLANNRFVAVVGTSSSGKSSLVRAGLLPALLGGLMASTGSDWRVAVLRPGGDPVGNLARALSDPHVLGAADPDNPDIQIALAEATLRRTSRGLVELVRQARLSPDQNLLIVVDQFEELFRYMALQDRSDSEAAHFVTLLLAAMWPREFPIYVVLTMRSDFLGDCARFPELPDALNAGGLYLVPRMTREQCREAIRGPIMVGGGRISTPLISQLLNDIGDNPDHLPILQHALMRTWDFWLATRRGDDDPVDLRHYNATGTMSAALSLHADEAFAELPDERSRQIAEKLFKALTEKGADNRETRRPTSLAEICAIAEAMPDETVAVIEVFRRPGRSFLMPPAGLMLTPDTILDISHESLVRNWERLKTWVDEESRSARIYGRLAETAVLHNKGRAGLWRDPDLQLALNWREESKPNKMWALRYHPDFENAMSFLDQSARTREAEAAVEERHRYKRLRQTRVALIVLAVLMLVSLSLSIYSLRLKREAETQRNLAEMQQKEALRLKAEMEEQKKLAEQRAKDAEEARAETVKAETESRAARR